MLVHKDTMGVLQWYWDGVSYITFDGVKRPKMAAVTLENHNLSPDEWWQVPNGTVLARKIALHYPFFDPVAEGDVLADIQVWPDWKKYGEEPPLLPPSVPGSRKYNRRRKNA